MRLEDFLAQIALSGVTTRSESNFFAKPSLCRNEG
jgi:hypothetical protein